MLVSNSINSHKNILNSLLKDCDGTLYIASPYLAEEMGGFLEEFDFSNVERVELITTFKPKNIEQLTKPFQIRDFFNHFKSRYPKMQVIVHVDNYLHGKLYILGKHNRKMIVTSANFTKNGMVGNHEFGLLIEDDTIIQQTLDELLDCIEYKEISYEQIKKACLFSETYSEDNPDWMQKPIIHCDILNKVYADTDPKNVSPKYYLKPLGSIKNPIGWDSQRDFSDPILNFPRRPKDLRNGDVIITTAIGCGALLSYFIAQGSAKERTSLELEKDSRRWYVEGMNQSPIFAKKWEVAKLTRNDLSNEFNELNSSIGLTNSGSKKVPIVLRGGHVQLTKEFGEFLISKIREYNR